VREACPTPPKASRAFLIRSALLTAVAASLLFAAGCSTATSSGSATAASASATAGSASSPAASPQLATAQGAVTKLLAVPTSIGITEPLKKAPTAKGTLVYLACDSALCQVLGQGVLAAAQTAGLPFKSIATQLANPATLVAGMQQALQMSPKPSGVVFAGIPEAVWSTEVPAFQKAGIPLIPVAVGATTASPAVPAGSLDGPADARAQAAAIAEFFIADSKSAGDSLVINVPDVGSLQLATKQYLSTVASGCAGCKVTSISVTLAQVAGNGVVPAVVSAVQRNPSVKYIVTPEGDYTLGLSAALAAAGLSGVQLLGINPDETDQQELATGAATAFSSLPFKILGWKAVDVALRYSEGQTISPGDGPLPLQLLTKATVGTPADSIDRPVDYQDQFKKLWKLS
jgi:ribose transport system substrate-binding protein